LKSKRPTTAEYVGQERITTKAEKIVRGSKYTQSAKIGVLQETTKKIGGDFDIIKKRMNY
jgi:hypothetical protein